MEFMLQNRLKKIAPTELLSGNRIILRLVTAEDCQLHYLNWLNDPLVNCYLETRWRPQTLTSILEFVQQMLVDPDNYLFAIVQARTNKHIGNIKLGPINWPHRYADISYFIGERAEWGQGYATEAIQLITQFGFAVLQLHRLQAGLYASNLGSAKALAKAGYVREASFKQQLLGPNGWEDHLWYAKLAE